MATLHYKLVCIFINFNLNQLIFYLIFDTRQLTVPNFPVRLSRALTSMGCHISLECTKEPGVWVNGSGGREVRKIEELSSPPKLSLIP